MAQRVVDPSGFRVMSVTMSLCVYKRVLLSRHIDAGPTSDRNNAMKQLFKALLYRRCRTPAETATALTGASASMARPSASELRTTASATAATAAPAALGAHVAVTKRPHKTCCICNTRRWTMVQ
ncbi:hypothetical protein AKJ16_DCAP12600 [Drosera capensis]